MAALASACAVLPSTDKEKQKLLLLRAATADNKKDDSDWTGHC
jgi:hypothetical protein